MLARQFSVLVSYSQRMQQEGGRQQDKTAVQSLSARKFVANCRFVRLLFSPSQEKFDAVRKRE